MVSCYRPTPAIVGCDDLPALCIGEWAWLNDKCRRSTLLYRYERIIQLPDICNARLIEALIRSFPRLPLSEYGDADGPANPCAKDN